MTQVMSNLNLEIPEYSSKLDPTKCNESLNVIEWTIEKMFIKQIKHLYEAKCTKKRKLLKSVEEIKKKDIKLES